MCPHGRRTSSAGTLRYRLCAKAAERDVQGVGKATRPPGDDDVATAQMMENFTHFCTHIGGTMVQSVCQASADDAKQVHFLVRIENQSPANKEFVRWHVTVYEPIGPPSAEFLRAIELYRS